MAVGTVALGTAGVAGAAPTTAPKAALHINCARAPKALARTEAAEARIATRLSKLGAAETKAQQHGNTTRAERIERRITRLEGAAHKARLDKRKANIEAKCHVSAPLAPSSSTAPAANAGNSSGTESTTV
ncbi:MAG: hypothetical protein ACRDYE_07400 [Acidimicrobiales bacterium]